MIVKDKSRRQLIKSAIAGTVGLSSLSYTSQLFSQQQERGIKGINAPELAVPYWIDGQGNEQAPFTISQHKGKWIYLKCFQEWCPACHSVGFPNLQKLVSAFPNNDVIVPAVIQTTFEGFYANTVEALRKNQLRYDLNLPFGHDPGNAESPHNSQHRRPSTMNLYNTRGTPWVILINPEGVVRFSDFQINIDALITYLKKNA